MPRSSPRSATISADAVDFGATRWGRPVLPRMKQLRPLPLPFLIAACAAAEPTPEPPPTFEEFEAATYREPWQGGAYIINGDTPVPDGKALREVWEELYPPPGALIVHHPDGLDARWNEQTKRALTYCVSDAFGARKAEVVAAMAAATEDGWERFADVDFVHLPAEDARCDAGNPAVLFDVRPVSGQPYLARAFFPNDPRSLREILIDASAFDTTWTLARILGHEAGHVLGFRHEHTRPEAGVCFEDDEWRPLTEYDAASVMHYPQCNGAADDLAFTDVDARGAAVLYGPPGGEPPPTPEPDGEHHEAGSLAAGEWRELAPRAVAPGSVLEVVLAGTGDADVYVRFDEAPTKLAYDCRPYLATSDEACAIDVPADAATAHVALHGFTAATYDLTVRWRAGGGDGPAALVINEILADPSAFDAGGDGTIDAVADEMVEIVNVGAGPADLGGATIADAVGVRVVLPAGAVLAPGDAVVVFGGGDPPPLGDGVLVAIGRLYLNNDGDTVTLRDRGGAVLASATYGADAGFDASVVRAPELDPAAPLVRHTTVSPAPASPGRRADGSPL